MNRCVGKCWVGVDSATNTVNYFVCGNRVFLCSKLFFVFLCLCVFVDSSCLVAVAIFLNLYCYLAILSLD
jgi:hypothetical protein